MKKISDFMYTAIRWKVAIVTFIFGFCVVNFIFLGLEYLFGGIDIPLIKKTILTSTIISLPLVVMVLLFIKMSEESIQFWKKAEEVEKLIEDANSKNEIKLACIELFKLYNMRIGRPHTYEVNRLVKIVQTKVNNLKL